MTAIGGFPVESPGDVAWLALFSTSTPPDPPALSEVEKGRLRMLREHAADVRVRQYAALVCLVNSIT